MNCKQIQELIITDYIDKQIDPKKKEKLRTHLKECNACRKFASVAEETMQPFNKAETTNAPEHIWQAVKNRIEESTQPAESNIIMDFLRNLSPLTILSRPRLAVVSVLVTVIFIGIFIIGQPLIKKAMINNYLNEQVLFLDGLEEDIADEDYLNLDTSIEEFFL